MTGTLIIVMPPLSCSSTVYTLFRWSEKGRAGQGKLFLRWECPLEAF